VAALSRGAEGGNGGVVWGHGKPHISRCCSQRFKVLVGIHISLKDDSGMPEL
jgi:hypothetical protein